MLNNYAESGGGFNSNHGQTSRPAEAAPKQHNIGSSWSSYNSQLEGMYYGSEQAMYMGPYDGSSKHANYPQYPHQPVPTPVVKCQEACCQHFQDRYPLNPAPLRYQPTQPRYDDSRQYFTDRRSMQPALSRKKAYPTDSAFPISDRHYSQFMGRGQFMPDSRQQMQMMRSQYPMYPPYWGSTRGYGPRMNCPPPPYHQSVSQGAQLQAGLKMADAHYMDPTQKSLGSQRHRTVGPSGGSEIIRPVPEPKRTALDPSLQNCYELGYPGGFMPFGEVNKVQGAGVTQNGSSSCKIPSDKQYHPHQMQYSMQASDRSMMNCSNPINDLSYSMNFSLPSGDPYIRAGLDDGQSLSDSRKSNLQYDSSLGKKRPDLDLRQYLATWEDDEEEGTRLSEPVTLGNSGAPYIVVDCRSLEGEASAKIQERFKTPQNCSSKSRSISPNGDCKRSDEQTKPSDNAESSSLTAEFQNQTSFATSMPNLISENDKAVNFWNGTERDGESISGKGSAFQPLDCSKRENNLDHNKRDPQAQIEMPTSKAPSNNEPGNLSFDNLVSYYGDTRRTTDGGYDFVEMTERLVNNPDKSAVNNHQIPPAMTRPCDPRLQQSHLGNNPSIYNKVSPRYSASNFPHFKPSMPPDPYYNFKHSMNPSKYFGYDNSQAIDPNYEYHKIASEFDPARLYSNRDATKDPRRLFHHELDKAAEGAFLDPVRKAQLNDCYQDKTPCEFTNGDPDQFISPIIVKKSDHSRDKAYSDKNNSIRERMDVINNENQNLPEKTVLITSQNGPPEIFRVPYSPEKALSNKDNVVTLHSGDQTKSNTITVEVPYVQQYSTLVKLSEEISRVENVDGKIKAKQDETSSSNKSTNDDTKKPTSFKLKRLPNSKEWAVENKGFSETNERVAPENNTLDSEKSSKYDVLGERDSLKSSVTASNLNMPSLDDFREDENCDTGAKNLSKNKITDNSICASNMCNATIEDSNKNNKYSSQLPQMAIVQPMKLNKCDENQLESDQTCKLPMKDCKDSQRNKPVSSVSVSNSNQNGFDPELVSSTSSHLELIPESDISKHGNFRTHKKIQSFPTRISNCLPSPSEEFLHSQEIGAESQKETYSPFHVYSDCDMNSQINEFFKMDERNTSSDKILDSRMPSSPGVEGMFEDINHSNPNNTFQPKNCDFPELSDSTINSHNAHFQSFSTIFSDDADRRERLDGSVLQMNDKKCFKNMLEDMKNQELTKSNDSLEHGKLDDSKKSPPIPPISLKLKLNESKKMWCIANKNQHLSDQTDVCTNELSIESRNLTHETLDMDAASELEKDLAQAIDEEKRKSSENYFGEVQGYSEINQLLSNGTSEGVPSHIIISENNISAESILAEQNTSEYQKITMNDAGFLENVGNKCLTITKYCPRNKIFKRINSIHGILSRPSKTLVFDEYGTHFPVIREETLSEAKSIAKDIIDDLILKFITDRYVMGKNNIAHVAPFCETPFNNSHRNEDEATMNCVSSLQTSESVIKCENLNVLKNAEEKESSIMKTTEMFIHIEKKYYQHHSVIKTVPPANNIVTKLRRPARSIFSPMSDHGKEDDEPIERTCDKELHQTESSQEENLKSLNSLNQADCFDLEIGNENQLMDVDLSDQCEINKSSTSEIVHDEIPPVNETKISQKESSESSCNHLHINGNHSVDQNSTEIDDALELMGLSNTKSVETTNDNLIYSSRHKVTAGCNLLYLQESSENKAGIEEQLASEEDVANSLIIKQLEKNSEKEIITKEQPLSLQIEHFKVLEETGTSVENGILDFDPQNNNTTAVSKTRTSNLEESTLCTDLEENSQGIVSYDSERRILNSNKILPIKTNPDECNVNKILLHQSPCQILSNENELLTTTTDGSTSTLTSTVAESEYNISYCTGNGLMDSDENNADEIQVDDSESRLETSVIVRNKTFYNISSRNVDSQKTHNHQESFKSYTESVFNVRNIINKVINDAVSKDVSQSQYYFKNPLKNEIIKTHGDSCSRDEACPLISVKDSMDHTDNPQETILKCSFEAKKDHHTFAPLQDSELNSERTKFVIDQKALVTTSKTMLPLDLTTSQTVMDNRISRKDSYCVSESASLCEEEEKSLFVKNMEPSYFHEFKKRKWQRFYRSFFNKDFSNTKKYLSCEQEGRVLNIPKNSFDHKRIKLLPTGNVCTVESTDCVTKIQSVMLVPPYSPSSEIEVNDVFHSDNNSKQNLNSKKSFRDSDVDFSTDEDENSEHAKCTVPNDITMKSGDETTFENQVQDLSIPLKDKVHFFNQKEAHSFLRRDSLKLLEREAVLKEIFSPDPEIDHSESKENEYPGNYDQHKQDGSLNHIECESNMSNVLFSSSVDGSTKQSSVSDPESLHNFPQTAQEVPSQNNSSHSALYQTIHVESNHKKVILTSEETDVKICNISDKSSCQEPEVLKSHLQLQHNSRALDIVENDLKNTTSPRNSSRLTDNIQDYVEHLNQPQLTKMASSSTILPTAFENVNSLVERSSEEVSQLLNVEKPTKDVINKEKLSISFSEVENISLSRAAEENTVNNRSLSLSPEEHSLLCQDKEILSPDQQEISNENTVNDVDINKTSMSYCHDSNTSGISSKIIQNKDCNAIALVTGKDVLFSTTQTSDDQDDEALNSSLHHKETPDREISYVEDDREDTNIISCHNDKINSVQDSLRNNQHLNKETFPLQCLVEAALALEHVDSKQMLLNNSNFPGLYTQSDEGFVESPLSDSPSHEIQEYSTKSNTTDVNLNSADKKKSLQNDLTLADKEIFSKFEETNYNLRASTRIVTSSSSNIIPYSKRKYGLKSAKSLSATSEVKQKKADTLISDKIKSKKRKSVFAYPRSKRRRKNNKDKQKPDVVLEPINQNNTETPLDTVDYEQMHDKFDKENILGNQSEEIEPFQSKEIDSINCSDHCSLYKSNSQLTKASTHLAEDESKNGFGGPLLIAGENTSSQGNIFCVHVDSEKMDDYVSNLNIGGLGILSDNNHSLFKDNNTDSIGSDIPNVSLENGTSLVIIIEDLDDNSDKIQFDDHCKSESDVMLGSVRDADCSDVLTTELSVNESCICPPDIGIKGSCESEFKSKLSYGRSDELLTTNCYEEINENLINDIGNWPFVEEEVAEFDNKSEFPNKIPEEGRKIELKCSLPWKKIFNISKDMKEKQEKKKSKKNKASRKTSGLELGPAKVEVRLKAPSAEWKVISDYHANSSPVVKVSRLILQRESDNSSSSYSEKDSEEENEHKKQCSEYSDLKSYVSPSCESYLTDNISKNENWQPIVVLKRSKELDELTSRLQSQTFSSLSNSQSSSSDEDKDEESSEDSDSDTSDDNEDCRCSQSRESSLSSDLFENNVISEPSKKYYKSKFCETNENDGVRYEKYSPTGCSNSLANEKIYSPSNPHFSPGEVYPDSDVNSNCGVDKVSSNCDNADDDVFLDETTHITNTEPQVISVENKIVETDNSESNDANQFEEESNSTDINRSQSKIENLPQSIFREISDESPTERIPSNDYSSDLNYSSPQKNINSEDEMGNTTVDYKSSVYSNTSSTSNEVNNTCKLSREFPYDQTKKTKRKMPKNFFVRKKVRRNQSEMASSNTNQVVFSSENSTPTTIENSPSSPSIAQSELQSRKRSLSDENEHNSESDLSVTCDNSRLHCVYNLEQSSPTRLNESSLPERFEEKRTLRNCGRGLKRPGEGHSREDTKRRRKKLRSLSNTCQECDIAFKNKVELTRHNAYKHARRRELHHCLLCQRSFSSAARHSLHVQGRSHRHLELTQRHTMHAIHRMVAGRDCPAISPLTRTELRALQWRPSQPGYTHVYHDTTPLHAVLQERSSELSEDTILSGEKIGDD